MRQERVKVFHNEELTVFIMLDGVGEILFLVRIKVVKF